MIEGYDWDALYVEMYKDVARKPLDGSLSEAIKVHAQACGFVAYVFDVHPDAVARAVQHNQQLDRDRELRERLRA